MLPLHFVTSFSCECDVASRSSTALNGWARIRQPPCQALVHGEQTPNPIWTAVYGTGWYTVMGTINLSVLKAITIIDNFKNALGDTDKF